MWLENNTFLLKYSCLFLNHTVRGIRGCMIGGSGISLFFQLLSSLSSVGVIRIRGSWTLTQTSACTHDESPARPSCLGRQDVCHHSCRFSVLVYLRLPSHNLTPSQSRMNRLRDSSRSRVLVFFSCVWGFIVQDHHQGPHAAGLKPLALFRDFSSHSVWKGGRVPLTVSSQYDRSSQWDKCLLEKLTEMYGV